LIFGEEMQTRIISMFRTCRYSYFDPPKDIAHGFASRARYCYAVWLHHLISANRHGFNDRPDSVAEIGPGVSLGVGLAALISGSSKYYAFDVLRHATAKTNLKVFDELVSLFERRERIPDGEEFPRLSGWLDTHDFPDHILDGDRMRGLLEPGRLKMIRDLVAGESSGEGTFEIKYVVPWTGSSFRMLEGTVDMIFSQEVMEHVDCLPAAYGAMRAFLKTGGYVSHKISFYAHDLIQPRWNSHWTVGDLAWKLLMGRRPRAFMINRVPVSGHVNLLEQNGFRIRSLIRKRDSENSIPRSALRGRFRGMSEDDLATRAAFIQAELAAPGKSS